MMAERPNRHRGTPGWGKWLIALVIALACLLSLQLGWDIWVGFDGPNDGITVLTASPLQVRPGQLVLLYAREEVRPNADCG